jgi:hypothetical protein
MVDCDEHGQSPGCLICRHLREERGLGYWAIRPDDDAPAMAWCIACNAMVTWDRGWTDRASALADWQIYCTFCYDKTLKRHKQVGWCSGGRPQRKRKGKSKRT